MPHSSGGGSHGGGTHFSSSGGSSFRGSSSGGSYSSARVSGAYFAGAHRYVYYDRRGNFRYLYADSRPDRPDITATVIACVIYTFIAAFLIWMFVSIGLYVPSRIDDSSYASGASITDNIGIIRNKSELMKSLAAVQEKTGISPSVEIVYESEWDGKYTNLETFAYSEYLRQFDDELHWLIVISYPDDYKTADFIDWSWEGMIGDDCYPAVNSQSEDMFTTIIHKHLLRSDYEQCGKQLAAAFNEFASSCMEQQTDVISLIVAGIFLIIYVLLMIFYIKDYVNSSRMAKAVRVRTKNPVEIKCEYCGRMYVLGTTEICRGCGAPVHQVLPSPEKEEKGKNAR